MTLRQAILRSLYPVFNFLNKILKKNMQSNTSELPSNTSFYDLKMTQNNGETFDFKKLENKKVLLVNTASDCGFTSQYDGLQKLFEEYKDKLVILAFPSNDFGQQEKGADETIQQFCKINFGVSFPLMKKDTVIKTKDQNPVFNWLTDKTKNGWNDKPPSWNFCKYFINESGNLTHIFEAAVEPTDEKIIGLITA
ncbi:MAG: glutathione peroxidase [Ferruginibacter sp.]